MYLDHENIFCLDQAVTATAASQGLVDLGAGDAGPAEGASLFVNVETPFTGNGILTVELKTSDQLNSGGTDLESAATVAAYPVSNDRLQAGGPALGARLPHGMKRYARLNFAVDGTLAAGTVTAGLVLDVQSRA